VPDEVRRFATDGVKTIETLRDFRRRQPLRQGCKAAHVDEQDRNLADLPARRSQFVSERAKVGVFARRADLHEPEGNRKQPQKRHQTFLAPLGRGEPAMKPARDLRGAQVTSQSDQESSHKTSQKCLKFGNEEEIGKTMSPPKTPKTKHSKHEIRSTKLETNSNVQKNRKFQTTSIWIRSFGISPVLGLLGCGLFRISCFGFWILFRCCLGGINFPGVVLFNISKVSNYTSFDCPAA